MNQCIKLIVIIIIKAGIVTLLSYLKKLVFIVGYTALANNGKVINVPRNIPSGNIEIPTSS